MQGNAQQGRAMYPELRLNASQFPGRPHGRRISAALAGRTGATVRGGLLSDIALLRHLRTALDSSLRSCPRFSPTSIQPGDSQLGNTPSAAHARKCSRVGRREIRQDHWSSSQSDLRELRHGLSRIVSTGSPAFAKLFHVQLVSAGSFTVGVSGAGPT